MKTQNRFVRVMAIAAVAAAALCALLPSRAQQPRFTPPPLMVVGKDGFLLMPPQTIGNGGESKVVPAPNGRYAVINQTKMDIATEDVLISPLEAGRYTKSGESQLILWDSRRMVSRTIWRAKFSEAGGSVLVDVQWFAGTTRAIVTLGETAFVNNVPTIQKGEGVIITNGGGVGYRYYMLNAATGAFSPIVSLTPPQNRRGFESPDVNLHPSLPIAIIGINGGYMTASDANGNPLTGETIKIVREDGTAKTVNLPGGSRWAYPSWSSDPGKFYVGEIKNTANDANGRPGRQITHYAVDIKTAVITKLAEKPKDMVSNYDEDKLASLKSQAEPLPVGLRNISVPAPKDSETPSVAVATPDPSAKSAAPKAGNGAKAAPKPQIKTVNLLYLQAVGEAAQNADSRLLLAAEAEPVALLPDASAAFYNVRGTLFVAPLLRVDAQTLLTMQQKAQQTATMSNAKQIGLGLMMYAQDYDENFPSDPGGVKDTIFPYIKNADVFNNPATGKSGFAYTYTGATNIGKIDKPAETQIGYVKGPGGRAVIYADGHVKWEPDGSN